MERQLWKAIMALLKEIDKPKFNSRCRFTSIMIVKVWFWAVLHDRPVLWACQHDNWPPHVRRGEIPSPATMSRRLRSRDVLFIREQLEKRVLRGNNSGNLVWIIDGKPLVIGGCSKDRQAGYGRAASSKAKGYKIHAIIGSDSSVAAWRLAPMNKDERVMGERMLRTTTIRGYVLADGNYDSNKLHARCDDRGNLQLVSPRRYGSDRGHGHRRQTVGRMRSKAILENPKPQFGEGLMRQREEIERFFANLTNWGGGLTHLPPWARTHRRVHRWVQAKLIINALKQQCKKRTYVT